MPLTEHELKLVDQLASVYRVANRVCNENNLRPVTISDISTGIYGFPWSVAAVVAKQICENEAGNIDLTLIAFIDDSLIELQQAPSAQILALLNGHKF